MSWSERTRNACGAAARDRLTDAMWLYSFARGPSGERRVFMAATRPEADRKADRWCSSRPGRARLSREMLLTELLDRRVDPDTG